MLQKREFDQNDFLWRLSTAVTVLSGLFTFVVFLLITINYLQIRAADPINNEMVKQMRMDYAALPEQDDALAERIQSLDYLTRKAFFTSQEHLRIGAILLLIGTSIFLISFKYMMRWKRDAPELAETPTAEVEFLAFAKSRQLITWGGVGMLAAGMLAALLTESALVNEPGSDIATAALTEPEPAGPTIAIPTWEDIEQNWPAFRGTSLGVAHYENVPTEWDGESGAGIKWKIPLELHGTNSPIVWNNRIFLSAADYDNRKVYAYDTETGDLVWEQTLENFTGTPPDGVSVTDETGNAAPTMVAHGEQVFAIFANGDLASYDFDGNFLWGKNVGIPDNHYGHSSSLLAYEGLLFVQLDSSGEAKLLALEVATGKQKWVAFRETISWASPSIAHTPAGPQLLLNSEETVDAYNPITGELIWSEECLGGEVAPSPAYSDGVVFVANEFAMATAIQVGEVEEGDGAQIIWDYDEYLPEVSSPVGDGERFYLATSIGDFVALDAKTGETNWAEEVSYGFYCSPILVGDKLYILDMEGNMYIIRAGAEYELISTQTLPEEETLATPAFMDGRIYIRTTTSLYCIENSDA